MMMNFDMGSKTLGNAVSNSGSTLAGNAIHEVLFKGVEHKVSADGKWEWCIFKFQGVDGGFFSDRNFGFDKDAGVRKKTQYGENPSQYESFMMKVKHLISAVAPDLLEAMQKGEVVFTPKGKSDLFKQYTLFLEEALKPYEGATTSIKLVKNNKGEAQMPPFFASVSRDGGVYMKTNFIGTNLSFTTKEKEAIDRETAAKPSAMPSVSTDLSLGDTETTSAVVEVKNDGDDLLNMQF